jgi:hypothetical protein
LKLGARRRPRHGSRLIDDDYFCRPDDNYFCRFGPS